MNSLKYILEEETITKLMYILNERWGNNEI